MSAKKKAAPKRVVHKTGHVAFKYRGSKHPTGTVVGVTTGGTKADPMLKIRPSKSSRHPGEPRIIHRRNSKVRKA